MAGFAEPNRTYTDPTYGHDRPVVPARSTGPMDADSIGTSGPARCYRSVKPGHVIHVHESRINGHIPWNPSLRVRYYALMDIYA